MTVDLEDQKRRGRALALATVLAFVFGAVVLVQAVRLYIGGGAEAPGAGLFGLVLLGSMALILVVVGFVLLGRIATSRARRANQQSETDG
ncbi:MAG: hypothetical protein GEV10_16515 [Streptosporangiales bacterium]|nr:hypothetical protein [Streptosporangiales bacterium]